MSTKKQQRIENKRRKLQCEIHLMASKGKTELLTGDNADAVDDVTAIRAMQRAKRNYTKPKFVVHQDQIDQLQGRLSTEHLQSLLLYALFGPNAPQKPHWCHLRPWRLVSQVFVLVLRRNEKNEATTECPFFDWLERRCAGRSVVQLGVPTESSVSVIDRLLAVHITPLELLKERLSMKTEKQQNWTSGCEVEPAASCSAKVAPTDLLMSTRQLLDCGYPFPSTSDSTDFSFRSASEPSYSAIHQRYLPVHLDSPLYAIDCEMCWTVVGKHELTRVSVVDLSGGIVLDTLVRPRNRITDHLTQFSGITADMLADCTVRLEEVQALLQHLLPRDAILCGHTLNCDFRALKIYHPYVIDLAHLFNLSGAPHLRSSLQTMAETFLRTQIQTCASGHCSIEDAHASMQLVRLKLKNGLQFGNVSLGWSYDDYARLNDIDPISGAPKRKQVANIAGRNGAVKRVHSPQPTLDCLRATKRPKLNVKKPKHVKYCANCGQLVKLVCRNKQCSCRMLEFRHCAHCPKNSPDLVDDPKLVDWRTALGVDRLPCVERRPIRRLFDQHKKKLALFTDRTCSDVRSDAAADPTFTSLVHLCQPLSSLADCCLYDFDTVFLENQESAKSDSEFVELLDGLYNRAAARSLFVVIDLNQTATAECYISVKNENF